MGIENAAFDDPSEQFLEHYGQVRGHVRSAVTRSNLSNHLLPGCLEVLDYQGGDGRDSIWVAKMGDRPTLLEQSTEMLKAAETNIKKEEARIRSRMKILPGGLQQLDGSAQFDVIMSHGVLMYELEDPLGQLSELADRLRQRGVLSLLTKGRTAARDQVPASDMDEFDKTGRYTNRLGLPVLAYSFEGLEALISQAGLETMARYGVRILSDDDRRPVDGLEETELNDIVAAEIEASQDPERMGQAQMLHVIARKPEA